MKFLIFLTSAILSVQAAEVYVGFDGLMPKYGYAYADFNYDGGWVPSSFTFRTFSDINSPYPTTWNYSVNNTLIMEGSDDFCGPDENSPGGIAIHILRYGLGFDDMSCPIPKYTTNRDKQWTWAEATTLDLDSIFDAAAQLSGGPSMDIDSLPGEDPNPPNTGEMQADSSTATGPGGMKRRRRDLPGPYVILELLNQFVNARFTLHI